MRYKSEGYLPNSMSNRPGFTSGRGATISDLDSKKLHHIHSEIKKNEGEDAARNFVDMVEDLTVASCTGFLLALYQLETDGWVYAKKEDTKKRNDIYAENEGEAIGTVLATLSSPGLRDSRKSDDTLRIVGPFLRNFGRMHKTTFNEDGFYMDENGYCYTTRVKK